MHRDEIGRGRPLQDCHEIAHGVAGIAVEAHVYGHRGAVHEQRVAVGLARFVRRVEDEGADSVIIASPHQQCFLDEVRQGLDAKGYQEVNLIGAFAAAVEMARAMVNIKLRQSPRAYPTDALKAKPAFR